jgi:TolA-binding protein
MEVMMKKVVFIITVFLVLGITAILLAETNKEYDTAVQFYNAGKYKEAINLLKIYVSKRPEPSA